MSDSLFEAPVTAELIDEIDRSCQHVWRDGDQVVARHRLARLPQRCLVCGDECDGTTLACKIRRRPGLLHFVMPILGVFMPSIVTRLHLCAVHRDRELRYRRIGHGVLIAALAMIVLPVFFFALLPGVSDWVLLVIPVGFMAGWSWVYYRIFRPRIAWAGRILGNHAWIPNAHGSVLRVLPGLPKSVREKLLE